MAAENTALVEIRALLAPMRANWLDLRGPRDSSPALTSVKHKLRDWMESRLHEFPDEDAARAFEHELNAELRSAKLSCDWEAFLPDKECPDRAEPGYLGEIKVNFSEVLVVTTAVGIVCGFDESAYAYSFIGGHWKLFWQGETNNYVNGKYVPLNFLGIQVSPRNFDNKDADPNVRLLLELARDPAYCESNWYNVYCRVWQLRIDRPEETLLLDGGEKAFLGDWVDGTVSPQDVLIEYSTSLTYTDFLVRPVVRHYILRGGRLERVAPLALSPRDFADEWMRTAWAVSSHWTSAGVSASSLARMHRKENFEGGEYMNTLYCEKLPEHWQVGLVWSNFDGHNVVDRKHMYLLVRWLPPYRFSMSGVSERPWTGCTQEDPAADAERTLFPVHSRQEWLR